jgi:hypothetical protein
MKTQKKNGRARASKQLKSIPLETRLGVLGYAQCEHEQVSTFIVPRAKTGSPAPALATARWWRLDWCSYCGALRSWTGPADSDAGPWLWPELSERWRK